MHCNFSFGKQMFSRTLFMLLFFLSSVGLFGQTNFKPGVITKNNGTVVKGYIDYREWEENPRFIKFKQDDKTNFEHLDVTDLLSFQMEETGEYYIKADVLKDMRPLDLAVLKNEQSNVDTTVRDTVFLRRIESCDLFTLYLLNDGKDHFYIKEAAGGYVELIYKLYYYSNNVGDFLVPKNIFRNQLQLYIASRTDLNKLNRRLERLKYNEKELGAFVSLLSNDPEARIKKTKRDNFSFIASAGYSFSTLKISGNTPLGDHDLKNSFSPIVGIGVEISTKRNLDELAIRPEISYSYLHYKSSFQRSNVINSTTKEESYSLKMNNYTPAVSVLYSFVRSEQTRVFAGIQLGYTFSSYTDNSMTKENEVGDGYTTYNDYLKFEKRWTNLSVKAGWVLRRKLEISGSVLFSGGFSRFTNIGADINIYSLQFAYHFK